jgi:hypothetical protein
MGSKMFSKLKSVDFFKKIPRCSPRTRPSRDTRPPAPPAPLTPPAARRSDLTEATLTGAWISIAAAVLMCLLFSMASDPEVVCACGPSVPPAARGRRAGTPARCRAPRGARRWGPSRRAAQVSDPCMPSPAAQEFVSFMQTKTTTELIVDQSAQNELLKVTFNIRCGRPPASIQRPSAPGS